MMRGIGLWAFAYYWFILLNAGIYALIGLATELLRRPIASHSAS